MKEKFDDPMLKFALYEPTQFIAMHLKDRLEFSKMDGLMARWMDWWRDGWIDGEMDGLMARWMDWWRDGWIDG
eukprot:6022638-Prymnesium_polylepis.1